VVLRTRIRGRQFRASATAKKSMRIVIANTARIWGGAEKIMMELVTGLSARGHQVLLLVRDGAPVSRALPASCHAVAIPGGFDFNPLGIWKTRRAIRSWNGDLLVIWTIKDMRIAAIGGRLAGVAVVIRRAYETDLPRTVRHRLLHTWAADHYVANARATKNNLLKTIDGLRDTDVDVVYNGIDADAIDHIPPVPLGLPADALTVAFIARLDPVKGVDELMRAWPAVADAVPNAHLVIAGTGRLHATVAEWAETADRVTLLGFRNDAIGILKSADVLVLPSYREGTPNVVMEAMACGTCIVATAVSGTPELVQDDISARLIPPHDHIALADALIEVLRDPSLRARLGARARERVGSFRFESMVENYIDLFRRIIGGGRD
jgi:glycosyltransferase involved in cell wall biosynthesis